MTKEVPHINVELEKLNKTGLADLSAKVGIEPHSNKAVMVNRLRNAITEDKLTSDFSEPDFDMELEAVNAPKPPREKKEKVAKELRPKKVYEWAEKSSYAGRQVYTSAGTGIIVRESVDNLSFEVQLADGSLKPVNAATTRFKAINDKYRDQYIKDDTVRTASGSPSIHSGRDISYALLGSNLTQLEKIAKENGLTEQFESYTTGRSKPLNPGMIRMNLGNILLARVLKGEAVTILGTGDLALAVKRGKQRGEEQSKAAAEAKAKAKADREEKAAAARAEREKAAQEKAEAKAAKPAKVKAEDVAPAAVEKPKKRKANA